LERIKKGALRMGAISRCRAARAFWIIWSVFLAEMIRGWTAFIPGAAASILEWVAFTLGWMAATSGWMPSILGLRKNRWVLARIIPL